MSFQRFTYHQHPPNRRAQKDRASDKKRYRAWCRRNPFYIKVQEIPIPSASSPPSLSSPKKSNIPTYYLPAQQQQRKPRYMNEALFYLRSHTTEGKEAYEWVSKGCLIGLREI